MEDPPWRVNSTVKLTQLSDSDFLDGGAPHEGKVMLGNLTGVRELLAECLRAPENGYVELFYKGKKGIACADCHSGVFQTDHSYYSIAMRQIGPGKGDNQEGYKYHIPSRRARSSLTVLGSIEK